MRGELVAVGMMAGMGLLLLLMGKKAPPVPPVPPEEPSARSLNWHFVV